jgi:hypothetical protein
MRKGPCPHGATPTWRKKTARCAMEASVFAEIPYRRARLAALRYRSMLLSRSVGYETQGYPRAGLPPQGCLKFQFSLWTRGRTSRIDSRGSRTPIHEVYRTGARGVVRSTGDAERWRLDAVYPGLSTRRPARERRRAPIQHLAQSHAINPWWGDAHNTHQAPVSPLCGKHRAQSPPPSRPRCHDDARECAK